MSWVTHYIIFKTVFEIDSYLLFHIRKLKSILHKFFLLVLSVFFPSRIRHSTARSNSLPLSGVGCVVPLDRSPIGWRALFRLIFQLLIVGSVYIRKIVNKSIYYKLNIQ